MVSYLSLLKTKKTDGGFTEQGNVFVCCVTKSTWQKDLGFAEQGNVLVCCVTKNTWQKDLGFAEQGNVFVCCVTKSTWQKDLGFGVTNKPSQKVLVVGPHKFGRKVLVTGSQKNLPRRS
ncbi:hypothetical protein BsWGS_25459 [Bradybaena similaris]